MSIYSRIRDLREDLDLTQKQVADSLYMHLTQYRRYETGASEVPFWAAIKLAQKYNVSLDYLSGLSNIKEPNNLQLSLDEQKYLALFKSLSETEKGRIMERMDILVAFSKKKPKNK